MALLLATGSHGPPGLVFRACATYYAASLDASGCHRLLVRLQERGVCAEAVGRRDLGIVSIAFGLGAATADDALRDAERLLEVASREAELPDAAHALGVVRVVR